MCLQEKASILWSTRDKPKKKSSLVRKANTSEIEALLCQHLTLEEDDISKDENTSEESVEQDDSILVNSTIANNDNPDNIRNLLSTIFKSAPTSKTEVNKDSDSTK